MPKFQLAAFVLTLSLTTVLASKKLPTNIQRCKINDGICIAKSIEFFLKTFAPGITDLGVPVFDLLFIPKIEIKAKTNGSFRLDTTYTDIYARGLSQIKIQSVNSVSLPTKYKLNIKLSAPDLKFDGKYKGGGTIFDTIALDGEGPFYIILLNSVMELNFDCAKTADGFLKITSLGLELTAPKIDVDFQNLVKGNTFLSSTALNTLKERIQIVFRELKGDYEAALAAVFKQLSSIVFDNVSIADLFVK